MGKKLENSHRHSKVYFSCKYNFVREKILNSDIHEQVMGARFLL